MNEAQRRAVLHGEGPLLLLAGPGSGKTFTITNRILYLLEQGVPPESILVITFTKEAALSMQNRFHKMAAISGPVFHPVNFGTFHSVFYHILRESHVLKSNHLLSLSEKKSLLLPILQSYARQSHVPPSASNVQRPNVTQEKLFSEGEDIFRSLNEDALQILSAVSYYKNTLRLSEAGRQAPAKWQSCFEAICGEYGAAVKRTGRIDFDDMLWECERLLRENRAAGEYWQKRFRHILLDEFQDINPVQYEAVKLLSASPHNLFAVGDDDQSIYGFRGSEPDCLRRFAEEFHAKRLLLDVNYRSRAEIVRASLAVIGENKNRFEKKLRAADRMEDVESQNAAGTRSIVGVLNTAETRSTAGMLHTAGTQSTLGIQSTIGSSRLVRQEREEPPQKLPGPVSIRAFVDKEAEYCYIMRQLSARGGTMDCSPSMEEGHSMESRAVLFRTNAGMQGAAARFKAAGIPYEMREKASNIYEHFIAADINSYLQAAHGEGRREQLLRIINRPSRYISREALGEGIVDFQAMRAYYERVQMPEHQKINVINALVRLEKQLQNIRRMPPLPAVQYILKAVGYERYLKEMWRTRPEKQQEWQDMLEWLKEDAAGFGSWQQWKAFQEEYAKALKQGGGKAAGGKSVSCPLQPRTKEPAVWLLTVHGAKGLEFDRVWIPDCNETNYPHGRMPDETSVEEERRIFYVAMTRAKKSLELLYLTGTKERPRQPSRFLNPLFLNERRADYSTSSSNSQLSRYSSKASATFSYSSSSSI